MREPTKPFILFSQTYANWNNGRKNGLRLNPDKCEIIRITRRKKPVTFDYTLHGKILKTIENTKSWGVSITKRAQMNNQINNISGKANASSNIASKPRKLHIKTCVRPKLEYCSIVWGTWWKQLTDRLEMTQRRAAWYTIHQYSYQSSVSAMLQQPHLMISVKHAVLTI